jgi:hypothetical protein
MGLLDLVSFLTSRRGKNVLFAILVVLIMIILFLMGGLILIGIMWG